MNPRTVIMYMFAGTYCLVLLAAVGASLFYPPGTVRETFTIEIFKMLATIAAITATLLALKEPPKEP